MNNMLSEIFFESAQIFIVAGSFVALLLGLGLIIAPVFTLQFNEKINTRISLREKTKVIETAIPSEPFFYKHAKTSGALLVIGSIYVLYYLVTFNAYSLIPYLPKSLNIIQWEWLIDSAQIFFYLMCSFTLIFGVIIFIRPSLVKGFEQAANHWISTRRGFRQMSLDINFTNKLVNAYPRIFGVFIGLFALIALYLLVPTL